MSLPYDRFNTTMKHWPLDKYCAEQYNDAEDRRFQGFLGSNVFSFSVTGGRIPICNFRIMFCDPVLMRRRSTARSGRRLKC
jgi:hypothetical protein